MKLLYIDWQVILSLKEKLAEILQLTNIKFRGGLIMKSVEELFESYKKCIDVNKWFDFNK